MNRLIGMNHELYLVERFLWVQGNSISVKVGHVTSLDPFNRRD